MTIWSHIKRRFRLDARQQTRPLNASGVLMSKNDQKKVWRLGFVHLIAIPIALAADSAVGIVYCVIVSGGALLMLRAFGVR